MIKRIDMANFKCFEDEHVPMAKINLLTGINGSGKSTLIQALLLLRQSHSQGLLRSGGLALNGDLVQLGAGYDAFYEFAEEDTLELGLLLEGERTAKWRFEYNRTAQTLVGAAKNEDVHDVIFSVPPIGGEVHYLAAERVGPRVGYQMADYAVEQQHQLGNKGEFAGHYLSQFGSSAAIGTAHVGHSSSVSGSLVHHVEAWLSEVSPNVRLQIDVFRDLDIVQLKYSFDGPSGKSRDYRPTNVGFGLSYTLSVIVAALTAKPGSLLIIENPEAHLHPRGQTRLTNLLAKVARGGAQVIIETHSDHILNGLRLAVCDDVIGPDDVQIHFFERRRTHERTYHTYTSPRIDASGRLEPWPSGFFDEMEMSLDRLITSKR